MATPTNLNAGSTTLASAGWEDASGFATAAAQLTIGAGTQGIYTAVDQSAAQVILSLTVTSQFSGNIGTAAVPLKFYATDTSAGEKTSANTEAFFLNRGSGSIFLSCGTTAGTNSIDNVTHSGSGTLTLVAGVFPYVKVTSGRLVISDNAVVQNLEVYGGTVTIEAAASTNMSSIKQFGGTVIIRRPVSVSPGQIDLYAGSMTYAYDNATGTATTIVNQWGGILYQKSGPFTTHNHYAGKHDYTDMYRLTTNGACLRTPSSTFAGQRSGGFLTITTDTTKGFPIFTS